MYITICVLEEPMNDINTLPPRPNNPPAPSGSDLDDLIFQGEGWLISDR